MSSWQLYGPYFENFDGRNKTWDVRFSFYMTFDTTERGFTYDVKYFRHKQGWQALPGWCYFDIHQDAWTTASYYYSFTFRAPANTTYETQFQICYRADGDTYNNKGQWPVSSTMPALRPSNDTTPAPPIYTWAWASGITNSWNNINVPDHGSDLNTTANALNKGQPTINFKRRIWNDMIDWMINTYNVVTNSSVTQSYFQNISGKNSYISTAGNSTVFTADIWNGMRTIANYTARALGGSNFLNVAVARGDPLTANIFSDVTSHLNGLINSYKYN